MFDATFWVGVSFFLFILLLVYKKVPQLVINQIDSKISEIKDKINNAETLKTESEKLLSKAQAKLEQSGKENSEILLKAQKISDDEVNATLEKMKISLDNKEKAAQSKIEQSKNDAIHQVKRVATEVALETLEKVLTENLDTKKQEEVNLNKLKTSIEKLKNIN